MNGDSAELLAEYVNGDNTAATRIVDKYTLRLIAIAQRQLSPVLQARVDPEDIVQSAYRSFFRKAKGEEISLDRSGDLWRTLAAFALNKARSRVEKELAQMRDPRRETDDSIWSDAMESGPTPEEATILIDQLASFMEGLSARDRQILELRLRGETVDAIAEALANPDLESAGEPESVSSATIRRVLRNTKRAFQKELLNDQNS